MKRKILWTLTICVVGLFLISTPPAFSGSATAETKELETVNFHLNWIWNPTHLFLMPGIYRGFFADEGIKLNILPGSGSVVAVRAVAMGKSEFGLASASVVLIAKGKKETPVKILSCLNQKGMTALWFRKGSGIKSAKDFEGKKIAGNPKSLKTEAVKIYLKLNGVDLSKVEFIGVPKGQDLKYLMLGKADAATFAFTAGKIHLGLQNRADEFDYIYLEDHGVTMMDLSFIVNDKVLQERADLVKRCMRAMMKSWRYANVFPNEAREMILRHVPTMSREYLEAGAEYDHFLHWRKETIGKPLGWISEEVFEKTQDTLSKAGKLKKRMNLKDIYTNDYVY